MHQSPPSGSEWDSGGRACSMGSSGSCMLPIFAVPDVLIKLRNVAKGGRGEGVLSRVATLGSRSFILKTVTEQDNFDHNSLLMVPRLGEETSKHPRWP